MHWYCLKNIYQIVKLLELIICWLNLNYLKFEFLFHLLVWIRIGRIYPEQRGNLLKRVY